jgi:hypothetical protein
MAALPDRLAVKFLLGAEMAKQEYITSDHRAAGFRMVKLFSATHVELWRSNTWNYNLICSLIQKD